MIVTFVLHVCSCLGDESTRISQVSMLYDGIEVCGVRLADGVSWDTPHSLKLAAVQDVRQDGMQQAVVSLYADIYTFEANTDTWVKMNDTFKLAEYQVCAYV